MERRRQYIGKLVLVGVLLACLRVGVQETTALEVGEEAPAFTLPSTLSTSAGRGARPVGRGTSPSFVGFERTHGNRKCDSCQYSYCMTTHFRHILPGNNPKEEP